MARVAALAGPTLWARTAVADKPGITAVCLRAASGCKVVVAADEVGTELASSRVAIGRLGVATDPVGQAVRVAHVAALRLPAASKAGQATARRDGPKVLLETTARSQTTGTRGGATV